MFQGSSQISPVPPEDNETEFMIHYFFIFNSLMEYWLGMSWMLIMAQDMAPAPEVHNLNGI